MSWKVIKELKEKRAKVYADAQSLRDLANKEDRDLTSDEEVRHASLLGEVENHSKRIAREETANAVGESINEARSLVGREDSEQRGNSLGMPQKDFRRYSLLRAIQLRTNNQPLDGIELECSQEIAHRTGKQAQGFYFPTEVAMSEQRTTLNTSTGSGAVPTIVSPNFIEILRNRLVTAQLGATVLPNMTGNFALPKQTAADTAYWVSEGSAPTTSNQTVGQVSFSPKTVGAYTDLTRKFINQSVFSAEEFVRNDIARVVAIALENAAFNGLGSSNQPLGLITNLVANYSGQVHAQGTNGAAMDFGDVVALETLVSSQNADFGKMAYVTNSKVKGSLKTTPKATITDEYGSVSVFAGFVWDNDEVNGYPAMSTNLIPSNGTKGGGSNLSSMVFGNFESLVYALWGGLDILVDPYTGSNSGTVRINALQDVDINVRYPESFAVCTDIVA